MTRLACRNPPAGTGSDGTIASASCSFGTKPRRKLGRHPERRLAGREQENPRRVREQRRNFLRALKLAAKRASDQMRRRDRRNRGGEDARQVAPGERIAGRA